MVPADASAARCAAPSTPYAPPETTAHPCAHNSLESFPVTCSPYDDAARDPTNEIEAAAMSSRRAGPRTHSAIGSSPCAFGSSRVNGSNDQAGHSASSDVIRRASTARAVSRSLAGVQLSARALVGPSTAS
ncbi:Uncharacterised protein [Mycobacteroides abscessus subsp. abscessus]|nr:Uncharacterised protein [Mycobacteroides abscessus subsp. abscessus]